jgi:hypothetical protein
MVAYQSLLVVFCAFILSFVSVVEAAPFSLEARDQDRCMGIMTREDRTEFHRRLDEARELWSREDSDSDSKPPLQLPKDNVTFNVSFTAVYANKSVEGGYVPADRIKAQIERLNTDYNSTGFSFVLVNTTWVHNPDWFVNAYPGSPGEKELKEKHSIGDARTLNVYTLIFNDTTLSLGASSMPSYYFRKPKLDGILLRHTTLPGGSMKGFDMGRTLTHEVGHWLGLFHIFEGGCSDGVGDNIADTPPQASGSTGCPKGKDSCPGDGPDLINNFMDYSADSCMDSFTPLQIVRMHEAARAFRRPSEQIRTVSDKNAWGGPRRPWQW